MVVRTRGKELLKDVSVCIAGSGGSHEVGRIPVTDTTPFQVMSASHPVVAFAVAVL